MSEQAPKDEEILFIIKELELNPTATQRVISARLGISLGKTNYLLKELVKKGLIEVKNFSDNPGKMRKLHYILTKDGIEHKIQLIQYFLKFKEQEYNLLKKEFEELALQKEG